MVFTYILLESHAPC
ncbi:hypothetical protein CFC21_066434 [Triticum aestivum]|uniref:Uncharacterized protein n=1 Tax=Triticum aestivum TaxID=4565 RepID=A0A9R1H708_WHEAT|nr:hypothetical protein CFC21_066434 [Triticum aestivum]